MASNHIADLLSAYLDGELSAAEEARVKSHLAACPACRTEEHELTVSWGLLGSLQPIEPSPAFRARFWERVKREEEAWQWFSWSRLAPVFAGFMGIWVAGVGLGMYLFIRQPAVKLGGQTWLGSDESSLAVTYMKRVPEDGL